MIIAAAQFTPVPGDIEANAARMAALITEAAERGAGLVLFSELALTHYDRHLIAADVAGTMPGWLPYGRPAGRPGSRRS